VQWIAKHALHIRWIIHYVDDFLIAAASRSVCRQDLDNFRHLLGELGLPEAVEKTEAPTKRLLFLGILIDTDAMSVSLDQARIKRIQALLGDWDGRQTCSLRELQSLVGTLSFASCVVRHGRTFIQHMRDLIRQACLEQGTHVRAIIALAGDFRDDLSWWQHFMTDWNGVSLLAESGWRDPASVVQVYTDACVDGFAAVVGTRWFHRRWSDEQEAAARDPDMARDSMPWKELYAVAAAAATWGSAWARKRVIFWTDCQPVVQALSKGASRTRRMMQLIRMLHFCAGRHSFSYCAQHIPGVDNSVADELSRVHDVSQLSAACRSSIDPLQTTPVLPTIPS
jgi:hypothetical protein